MIPGRASGRSSRKIPGALPGLTFKDTDDEVSWRS
jgi:hypothetical protein